MLLNVASEGMFMAKLKGLLKRARSVQHNRKRVSSALHHVLGSEGEIFDGYTVGKCQRKFFIVNFPRIRPFFQATVIF